MSEAGDVKPASIRLKAQREKAPTYCGALLAEPLREALAGGQVEADHFQYRQFQNSNKSTQRWLGEMSPTFLEMSEAARWLSSNASTLSEERTQGRWRFPLFEARYQCGGNPPRRDRPHGEKSGQRSTFCWDGSTRDWSTRGHLNVSNAFSTQRSCRLMMHLTGWGH
jgi:hypothetical protein